MNHALTLKVIRSFAKHKQYTNEINEVMVKYLLNKICCSESDNKQHANQITRCGHSTQSFSRQQIMKPIGVQPRKHDTNHHFGSLTNDTF